MKNLALAASLISISILSACSGNDTPAYDSSLSSSSDSAIVAPSNDITPSVSDSAVNIINPVPSGTQMPGTITQTSVTPVPANKPTAIPVTKSSGLNPAHGEPGHRCEIAVGAPLNSTPTATPAPVQPSPVVSQPAIQAKPTTSVIPSGSSAKINPPHGQPGHDCAVQVGAPLKN